MRKSINRNYEKALLYGSEEIIEDLDGKKMEIDKKADCTKRLMQ